MDELNRDDCNMGIVKISDEVISVIAAIATSEIKGVMGMNPGMTAGGITQLLTGKKNNTKGVKVTVDDENTVLDVALTVEYGVNIPDIVTKVQENVKKSVEAMTGLNVSSVNVFVQHIVVEKQVSNNEQ